MTTDKNLKDFAIAVYLDAFLDIFSGILSSILFGIFARVVLLILVFWQLLFVFSSFSQASELPISPDGSTNTQIDRSANDVQVVNIATPNSGGLSHNKFNDYNVNQNGLILNNATGNQNGVVQTNIGGLINDNANLRNSGSAAVILNEVTSNNISQINGYTEIAGKQADLVLANPNGFVFNGAGFINVSRFTAVVGSSNQSNYNQSNSSQLNSNSSDLTFKLSDKAYALTHGFLPKLTIIGSGIDLENVTSTDLVTNVMNIVAPIYAGNNEVNLRAGDQGFNYATKEVTSDNSNVGSNLPDEVAIDASSFGKIQAGRIFIVATKEGFGIKYSGDLLAQRAGIKIDIQGNIIYNNLLSEVGNGSGSEVGNIEIKSSKGNITQTGIAMTKDVNSNILINAKDVTNSGQIISSKDIIINAINLNNANLNNNTSTSKILTLGNINLNVISLDNSNALIQSSNNLTLRNLVLTSPAIANSFDATQQNTEIKNINGTFFAGNLIDFDLGNLTDYEINGNLQSLGSIKIKANNIINKTNLLAEDSIEITAADKFTNGVFSDDNSNNKIIAENNINITSTNLLNNYATLSSGTNLTLISTTGDINNNANAQIIGGIGNLTLSAKNGTVNQNSLHSIVANGDYNLDVVDFINTGRVDVAGNLVLNVANDLVNESGAMIYSGGTMDLNVVHNLTNKTDAAIYSEGNLTIQKYAITNPLYNSANNRIKQLENLSADITSNNGNINISANEINNNRTDIYTQTIIRWMDDYCGCEWEDHYDLHEKATYAGTITKAAQIYAGNNININSNYILSDLGATKLINKSSSIIAGNNIDLNIGTLNNNSNSFKSYTKFEDYWWYGRGDWNLRLDNAAYINLVEENFPAFFKAGHDFNSHVVNDISNEDLIENIPIDKQLNKTPTYVNSINIDDLLNNGAIETDLSNYLSGLDTQGLFQKSTNPNAPLFETRSQFIDQSQFFGSDYFYNKIGLNLNDVQTEFEQSSKRLVGDQFFQTKIIEEQLRTISKNSFLLSSSETNINNEIKNLLDNAADEYIRLGLSTNTTLTQAQINSLQKDIIWFETKIINGAAYIVPKIYLSQSTRDNLKNNNLANNATIYASNNINLTSTSGKITNSGSITANNVNLVANDDVTNKNFSNIKAFNDLSITSNTEGINNFSQITANNAVTLNAAKNINNFATISTNDSDLLNNNNPAYIKNSADERTTGNISSKLIETAEISGGNVSINAGNDFNNIGSNIISTTGNTSITSGNNINISSLALRNRTETTWGTKKKGGTSISDTSTNIGSNITSAGNLDITSTGLSANAITGDINIIGSNLSAAGNGSLTSEFGNINITNAVDSKMTEETSWKKGSFSSRYDSVYDYVETAVESKLDFGGNLNVNAELGTINLIGSTLKTEGDLNIGNFTIAQNPDGSYKTNADGTFQSVNSGSVAGVNIKSAELKSEHSEVHQKSKLSLGDTLKLALNPIEVIKLNLEVMKFMAAPVFKKDVLEIDNGPKFEKSSAKSNIATTTQHSSTLDVGKNMIINSTGDLNIAASNVNVTGNALMNVDGNINITSAAEKTISSRKNKEIEIGTFKLSKDLAHASASLGMQGTGLEFEDLLTTTTQKSSNINIGGSMLASVTNNSNTIDSGNMTLAASNLIVGDQGNGDAIIRTAGDFNLNDAQETSSYNNKESILDVEVGVKVGNAYVDANYAWKAVIDAQKKAIEAAEKLKKMEKLREQGKATSKAVELAAAQVILAQTAVASATIAASAANAGAASASFSSLGTAMYGAAYLNITTTGIKNTTDTSTSKASNFIVNDNVDIASNNNLNVIGSILSSVNGDVNLSANKDIKIESGTNILNQKSKQETIFGGGSVGNNGVQLNIGMSQDESDYSKTFYTNSQVNAENGSLTLNTGNDANISGANILAKNIVLDIGNNLNLSSKQTEEDYSSSGYGFNFGIGSGSESKIVSKSGTSQNGGNNGNIGGGFNMSNANMHRIWVDDISTIKGTENMTININKDLNLTGAAILSNNLSLVVNGNINKNELQDSYYSENMGFGIFTNFITNKNQSTIPGTGGKPNQSPSGSTEISANYTQNESTRTVYATIGNLDSTLTSTTKDVTGGDFEGSLTMDHRLFSEEGRNSIMSDIKNVGSNLKTMRENANKSPLNIGAILNAPNTLLEGAIYSFNEKKDVEGGSQAIKVKFEDGKLVPLLDENGQIMIVTDVSTTKNYAVNGIDTDFDVAVNNYFTKNGNSNELTLRFNPTHGILGDLVESGFGKIFDWIEMEDVMAMNRIVVEDLRDRKDLQATKNPNTELFENIPTNLFHSQGTIIGKGAIELYAKTYNGIDNQIDQTQKFVAVGPAVLESDWKEVTSDIGLIWKKDNYKHSDEDPVRYLAAPSNIISQITTMAVGKEVNSPLYLPNIWDTVLGVWNIKDINEHSVNNPVYMQFIDPTVVNKEKL